MIISAPIGVWKLNFSLDKTLNVGWRVRYQTGHVFHTHPAHTTIALKHVLHSDASMTDYLHEIEIPRTDDVRGIVEIICVKSVRPHHTTFGANPFNFMIDSTC